MRIKHSALILTAGFLLIPTLTWSQGPGGGRPGGGGGRQFSPSGGADGGFGAAAPGGGFGGMQFQMGGQSGGGGGFGGAPGMGMGGPGSGGGGRGGGGRMFGDPNQFFDQYSKDGRVLRKEDLPQQLQMALQFMGPQIGLTGDSWTREQLQQIGQNLRNRFAPGTVIAQTGTGGPPGMGGMAPQMMAFAPGGPGAMDPDRRVEDIFNRMDKNQNGVLEYDEMSETLQNERDKYDTNHNGVIELDEFKAYIAARRGDGNNTGPDRKGPDGAPVDGEERKRPTIVRANNMPRDFPFAALDRDQDGQIGLYEWKEAGRPIAEFLAMDLNNDGFLTVDEYFRWKQQEADALAKANGTQGGQFGAARGRGGMGDKMAMGGMGNGMPGGMGMGTPGGMGMGMPGGMGMGMPGGMGMGRGGPGGNMWNGNNGQFGRVPGDMSGMMPGMGMGGPGGRGRGGPGGGGDTGAGLGGPGGGGFGGPGGGGPGGRMRGGPGAVGGSDNAGPGGGTGGGGPGGGRGRGGPGGGGNDNASPGGGGPGGGGRGNGGGRNGGGRNGGG